MPLIANAPRQQTVYQQTASSATPEKLQAAIDTPLWNYLPKEMQADLSPADFAREVAAKNPSDKFMASIAGIESGLGATAQAFTSPFALSMPMAGVSRLAAQKAVAVAFGAQMVAQNPDIGAELGAEMGKPPAQRDWAKISQLMTEGFANSALAGLMFGHAMFRHEAPVLPRPTEGTPADFMQQQTTGQNVDLTAQKADPLGIEPNAARTPGGAPDIIQNALNQLRNEPKEAGAVPTDVPTLTKNIGRGTTAASQAPAAQEWRKRPVQMI